MFTADIVKANLDWLNSTQELKTKKFGNHRMLMVLLEFKLKANISLDKIKHKHAQN